MVNARLCEMARQAFFFASLRHFNFIDCKTEIPKCLSARDVQALKFKPQIYLRARMNLYNLLASFFEMAGTGTLILTHYVMISKNKITVSLAPKLMSR